MVTCERMDLLWRFLLGGAIVSLFALLGDVVRPKRFAGIFGGAVAAELFIERAIARLRTRTR